MTKFLSAALLFCTCFSFAQTKPQSFTVKHISATIVSDGVLDEPIWETAESVSNFWQYFPIDSIPAKKQTEIKILYDDTNIYVGIKVETAGNNYVIQSLKRDFRAGGNDNITLLFDTFNDTNNAFLFGINPYGVRREGVISGGGFNRNGFSVSWDVKWKGESKIYDDYYTAELIIPLTSFKFEEGETKWRFNSYRFDTQSNENSTWVNIPQNQFIVNLAYMGDMIFEKPLPKSRTPLAIIPYVNALSQKDFAENDNKNSLKFGGDAKVSVGNSMNLDITVNPDFSQVEVDDQVTNVTRFEVSLPEKRQFFIDNSDLFSSFGGRRDANPFFSRRIGIARDTADANIENKIIGGIRLSGKLNKNLRLGFLSIQTADDVANEISSNNNTMFALQQKVFSKSNIGMFFINKQSFSDYDFLEDEDKYNRVLGVDYNLVADNNKWMGKFYAHKSFQPEGEGVFDSDNNPVIDDDHNLSLGAFMQFNNKNYNLFTDWVYIDDEFRSDLGFIRRKDIIKAVLGGERIFWLKDKAIQNHSFELFPMAIWKPGLNYKKTDHNIVTTWSARFQNQSRISVQYSNRYIFLQDDFDPTGKDDAVPLAGNQGYHFNRYAFSYGSDRRKMLSGFIESSFGQFYNGSRFAVRTDFNLRFQPRVAFSLILNYDNIDLPEPHSSADIWLVSPKIDITFSKSVFWSTLIQYSNQRDNLGFNSRLQWRFAPLSDLFLVYNDNYYVNSFEPKNRSINLKFTYWLNI